MESEAADTLDFVVSQTWKCLSVPATGKNSVFSALFFDEENLSEVASAANIIFCPGLLDVVQAPSPPDVSFFKTLPTKSVGLWAIYSLVLEKPGCTTVVYTGEASNAKTGVPNRWRIYNNPQKHRQFLPSKVAEALDAGYKITHKGVLAWYSIPSAKDVPRFRVLNYCMEAMFSFYFWTMYSKTKDYQIGSCCPWPRESFTYGGLCSHSSLNDPMRANLKLSAEQLEMLAAQSAEDQRLRGNIRAKRNRVAKKARDPEGYSQGLQDRYARRKAKDPGFYKIDNKNSYDRRKAADPVAFKADAAAKHHFRYNDPILGPKMRASSQANHVRLRAERMASKEFHCDICPKTLKNKSALQRHFMSTRHKKKVAKRAAGVVFKYRCDLCNLATNDRSNWSRHVATDGHKAAVEKAEA